MAESLEGNPNVINVSWQIELAVDAGVVAAWAAKGAAARGRDMFRRMRGYVSSEEQKWQEVLEDYEHGLGMTTLVDPSIPDKKLKDVALGAADDVVEKHVVEPSKELEIPPIVEVRPIAPNNTFDEDPEELIARRNKAVWGLAEALTANGVEAVPNIHPLLVGSKTPAAFDAAMAYGVTDFSQQINAKRPESHHRETPVIGVASPGFLAGVFGRRIGPIIESAQPEEVLLLEDAGERLGQNFWGRRTLEGHESRITYNLH